MACSEPPHWNTGTSWRDYLPDLARAMLLVVGVIVISVVATVVVVGAAK